MSYSYSASALKTLTRCQKKFWHTYINKTQKDIGWSSPDYYRFGSALHKILETVRWDYKGCTQDLIMKTAEDYNLDEEDAAKIAAMLRCIFAWFIDSKYKIIGCEIKFDTNIYHGVVDIILEDAEGHWYIADLKSASHIDENLPSLLISDVQMCIYHEASEKIAREIHLDINKYKGLLYLQCKKPLERLKKGEDYISLTQRCTSLINPIYIDTTKRIPVTAYESLIEQAEEGIALCNTNACIEFHNPCEYFSSCHGKEYKK